MHREREKTAVLKTGIGLKFGLALGNKEEAAAMIHILRYAFSPSSHHKF